MTLHDELKEHLRPFVELDVTADLDVYLDGIAEMFEPIATWVRDHDEALTGIPVGPGWTILLDIDTIPNEHLDYIAQFIGVRIINGLSDADQRSRIEGAPGFYRGTPGANIAEVQATLTGRKIVFLRERDPSPWRYDVMTYADETPDPARTLAALKRQKPIGMLFTYNTFAGQDWRTVRNDNATWRILRTKYATWRAMRDDEPAT